MTELDLATVMAANDAWVWQPPGSDVHETDEYRLVLFPERFPDRLQVQGLHSTRPAEALLDDIVARAAGFGQPDAVFVVRPSAPEGLDAVLLERGAELFGTGDILAVPLPSDIQAPDVPGLEVRRRTDPQTARDANTVGIAIFGGTPASDEIVAEQAAADRETFASGDGGGFVGYLDGVPAGVAGVQVVDGVARLWGGGVLEEHRGRGVYRALVAARLAYAAEHDVSMALTQGRVTTSSPILRRLGFAAYGQERLFRLPLG